MLTAQGNAILLVALSSPELVFGPYSFTFAPRGLYWPTQGIIDGRAPGPEALLDGEASREKSWSVERGAAFRGAARDKGVERLADILGNRRRLVLGKRLLAEAV